MKRRSEARAIRRAWLGLATALGLARGGVFIPYRYAATLDDPRWRGVYPAVEGLFQRHEAAFRTVLGLIDTYAESLLAFGLEPPPAPRFEQDWFPRADAAAAYALVRTHKPARVVELGSGHSTRFLARAAKDGEFPCTITAIDPAPRADIARLPNVTQIRSPLQDAGLAPFEALQAGDVLFVDSSHVLMPGSDVDIVLNRIIPALPPGVLVHLHDIFLPDDYPADWAWRGYNEQQGVAPLLFGGRLAPLFASHYVATRMAEALAGSMAARLPMPDGARESSLWLTTK